MPDTRDVVIIGGGHNGLVTAFYLAKAGYKPLVLERRAATRRRRHHRGISSRAFAVRFSRIRPVRFVLTSSVTCNWKSTASS